MISTLINRKQKLNLPQIIEAIFKQAHERTYQQKSLKQLFFNKIKNNLIQQIQLKLMKQLNHKVLQKTLIYLTTYINYYQTIYQIINNNINNRHQFIQKYKNTQNLSKNNSFINPLNQKKKSLHQNQKIKYKNIKNKDFVHDQKSFVAKIRETSYKCKCLKEFFQIDKYSNNNIIQTVVDIIFKKYTQGLIKNLQENKSQFNSFLRENIKKISIKSIKETKQNKNKIDNHKSIIDINNNSKKYYMPLIYNKSKENRNIGNFSCHIDAKTNKQQKYQLQHYSITRQISPIRQRNLCYKQLSIQKQNIGNKEIFLPRKKQVRIVEIRDAKKKFILVNDSLNQNDQDRQNLIKIRKNISREVRRNGFQQLNRISVKMKRFKELIKQNLSDSDDIMDIASKLKNSLDLILNHLIIKKITFKQKKRIIQKQNIR